MDATLIRLVDEGLLFCPFCQAALSIRSGELYCAVGDCEFSPHVASLIKAGIDTASSVTTFAGALPAQAFGCPNCKSPLLFSEGRAECTVCGFVSPPGLHFNLSQRHVHCKAP